MPGEVSLTKADIAFLQRAAVEPIDARRPNVERARRLFRAGMLREAGISQMWGYLYFITPAGRAAIAKSGGG